MPWSASCFDSRVERLIRRIAPTSAVDIGPGAGKYGEMIRRTCRNARTLAVEAEKDYIDRFDLSTKYDSVVCARAEDYFFARPNFFTELVVFGDVLEHLRKSVAVDLLHHFAYRARFMIVIFPVKYVQYSWEGYGAEAHLSSWGIEDFAGFKTESWAEDRMRLVLVTGFLEDKEAFITQETAEILSGS